MQNEMEFFLTTRPDLKVGIRMSVNVYETIKNEIIRMLDNNEGVPLLSFFEILHTRFSGVLGEEVGWYLYHVKLDMQTRGLITVEYSKGRRNMRPVIKMVRKKRLRGTAA
jgi:hypothetical protein